MAKKFHDDKYGNYPRAEILIQREFLRDLWTRYKNKCQFNGEEMTQTIFAEQTLGITQGGFSQWITKDDEKEGAPCPHDRFWRLMSIFQPSDKELNKFFNLCPQIAENYQRELTDFAAGFEYLYPETVTEDIEESVFNDPRLEQQKPKTR